MSIKKFDLRGLDATANVQIVTTDNLTSNVVATAFSAAFGNVNGFGGATGPVGATGATGP